jgi:hypothetical protein
VQGVKTMHTLWSPVSPSFEDMLKTDDAGMKSGGERPAIKVDISPTVGDRLPGRQGVSHHQRGSRMPSRGAGEGQTVGHHKPCQV